MADLLQLSRITPAVTRRESSWDRSGRNTDCIMVGPGQTATLAMLEGPGVVRHIYFTMIRPDLLDYRQAVLRMYWDDESEPSVEVPMGDFFCVGHCMVRRFASELVVVNPGSDEDPVNHGFNCYFAMPFARSARIEIVNQSDRYLGGIFGRLWYHIDWEAWPTALPDDCGRFHAQWRRENPTSGAAGSGKFPPNLSGQENYVILEAEGWGHVVGLFLQVDNVQGGWYGEGDDMIFIDEDSWPPSLHGTGTEEVFGGGAGPDREYAGPYTGFVLVENHGGEHYRGKNAMYRWYVRDPIRFRQRIRMTIEHGHANDFRNDYASVAYWYQHEPHSPFPVLAPASSRLPRIPDAGAALTSVRGELNRAFVPLWQIILEESPVPDQVSEAFHIYSAADSALVRGQFELAKRLYGSALRVLGAAPSGQGGHV